MLQIPLHFQKCTYFLFYHHTQTHTIANRDQAYINSFRNLLTFSPVVKTELAMEGSDKEKIRTLLDTAWSSTRRLNASSIKDAIGIGMTSVLDLARKRIQPEARTMMSVQGCCAP